MNNFILFLKSKPWFALCIIVVMVGAAGIVIIFYQLSKSNLTVKAQLEKMQNQMGYSVNQFDALQKKYDQSRADYDQLEADRNNILVQTKQLLQDKTKLTEIEEKFVNLSKKYVVSMKDRTRLGSELESITQTQESLKQRLEETETDNASLKKQFEGIDAERKEYDKQVADSNLIIEKLKTEIKDIHELEAKNEQLEKENKTLEKDNRKLAGELKKAPRKFGEMAHQNKVLLKETAYMHYNLGVFYADRGEFAKALKEFKKTVDLNPDDAKAHYNIGYIYAERYDQRDKAEEHFRKFLGLDPEDESADWVRNYLLTNSLYDGKVLKT